MKQSELFSISSCTDQIHLAERELSAFIAAVAELFGAGQARLSAEDWLDESESMDVSPRSTHRDWQTITIAASARLASRVNVRDPIIRSRSARRQPTIGTQGLAIQSPNVFDSTSGVTRSSHSVPPGGRNETLAERESQ